MFRLQRSWNLHVLLHPWISLISLKTFRPPFDARNLTCSDYRRCYQPRTPRLKLLEHLLVPTLCSQISLSYVDSLFHFQFFIFRAWSIDCFLNYNSQNISLDGDLDDDAYFK
jgi:hypothetical protein